jgi:glycosyltransferase involved in cell wall biosynthesis
MPLSPTPFFSIITATFNYAKYLPRALDSVLAQNDSDYEIVVVDDGSTDETGEVIRNYRSRAVCKIIYHAFQENRGPAAARNHGVRLSTGQYVLFLDADDALLPNALDRFRSIVGNGSAFDFVWGGHIQVNLDGKIEQHAAKPLSSEKEQNFLLYMQSGPGMINVGTMLIRRTVFDRIQWPESTYIWADLVFNSHLLALFNGASFAEPIITIYKHENSLQDNIALIGRDRLKTVNLLFNPAILPAELMSMRGEYLALVWRSVSDLINRGLMQPNDVQRECLKALRIFWDQSVPIDIRPIRNVTLSRSLLSLFRSLYRKGYYLAAKALYPVAVRTYPLHLFRLRYLAKYAWVTLRVLGGR